MDPLRHHGDVDATPGLLDFAVNVRGEAPPRVAAGPARRRTRRPRPLPLGRPRRRSAGVGRGAARPRVRTRCSSSRGARRGSRCSPPCGRGSRPSCTPGSPSRRRHCGQRACRWCGCTPTPPTATGCGPTPFRRRPISSSSATRPTRPASCTPPPRCERCARRGGSCSSTRRSPTPYRGRRSRWRRDARVPGVPQPHEDLGARRVARGLRARRARGAGPAGGSAAAVAGVDARAGGGDRVLARPPPWRRPIGRPATWSGGGPRRRRRSPRCPG